MDQWSGLIWDCDVNTFMGHKTFEMCVSDASSHAQIWLN